MSLTDEQLFQCPYCGTENSLTIDLSAGSHQKLLTDCEICCRPIVLHIELDQDELIQLSAEPENP